MRKMKNMKNKNQYEINKYMLLKLIAKLLVNVIRSICIYSLSKY